jgi:hypothetical protein
MTALLRPNYLTLSLTWQADTMELPPVPIPKHREAIPLENISTEASKRLLKEIKSSKKAIFATVIFELLAGYWVLSGMLNGTIEDPAVLWVLLIPLVFAGARYAAIVSELRHELYKQFALVNGFSYQAKGWLEDQVGAIFSIGSNKIMQDIVSGNLAGCPLKLFNYFYTVGSGKHSNTYTRTVLSLNLEMDLPSTILLQDKSVFGDDLSDNNIRNISRLPLSAELEKHYTLFSERKMEIEALQIFSEDFLTSIKDKFPEYSLDFFGKTFYVYSSQPVFNRSALVDMLDFAKTVLTRLSVVLPQMQGSIVALNESLSKSEKKLLNFSSFNPSHKSSHSEIPEFFWVLFPIVLGILIGIIISLN